MGEPHFVEPATAVKFPCTQQFWPGVELVGLGAGCRHKKVLCANFKVYAGMLYVDPRGAASALAQVKDDNFDAVSDAILHGNFEKVMQLHLVRDITGAQFVGGLNQELKPRLTNGGHEQMEQMMQTFLNYKLHTHTNFIVHWDGDKKVDFTMAEPGVTDFSKVEPVLTLHSTSFARALFDLWLGPHSLMPEGRQQWVRKASQVLDDANGSVNGKQQVPNGK